MTTTPSRRTVLRATAWTAPAIAVVAAAPAFAASSTDVGIAISPVCEVYSNAALRISATGTNDIPAGLIVTLVDAGPDAYTSYNGAIRYYDGPSFAFPSVIPAGGYGLIYFESYSAYPTPGIALTLPAGYRATAGSTLTGSTTWDACFGGVARRSTPAPRLEAP